MTQAQSFVSRLTTTASAVEGRTRMATTYRDRVMQVGELWYCVVNGQAFGGWVSRALAEAGMKVEQSRALRREKPPAA